MYSVWNKFQNSDSFAVYRNGREKWMSAGKQKSPKLSIAYLLGKDECITKPNLLMNQWTIFDWIRFISQQNYVLHIWLIDIKFHIWWIRCDRVVIYIQIKGMFFTLKINIRQINKAHLVAQSYMRICRKPVNIYSVEK